MTTVLLPAPRTRARHRQLTLPVWTTDQAAYFGDGRAILQACLAHLRAKRGPTPAQQRAARHAATIQRLIAEEAQRRQQARVVPNVCTALPLAGGPLVPVATIRYQ